MPQPIPVGKEINGDFRRDSVLQRPKLAPYIAAIAMHWNEIESRIAILMAALLGAESRTVIKVFLALQSDGAKKATIDTVAELKLSVADLARFHEIQTLIGARYAERNKAIHGAWGICPEYPDELLWYDPRETVALFPELMARLDPSQQTERQILIDEINRQIRRYNERDLKQILERMNSAYTELDEFSKPFVSPLFAKMHTTSPPKT